MLETALAQLQFGLTADGTAVQPACLGPAGGRPAGDTARFGASERQAAELVNGPALDAEGRREMQIRRFRGQATCGAGHSLLRRAVPAAGAARPAAGLGVARLPPTTKEMVRAGGDAFVCRYSRPTFCAMTTGTTGKPAAIRFSGANMMNTYMGLAAISLLIPVRRAPRISCSTRPAPAPSGQLVRDGRLHAHRRRRVPDRHRRARGRPGPAGRRCLLAGKRDTGQHFADLSLLPRAPGGDGAAAGYRPQDFGLHTPLRRVARL